MTRYAIVRTRDRRYWSTYADVETWVESPLAARSFEFMADAQMHALVECTEPVQCWSAVPIEVPDLPRDRVQQNERIVTAHVQKVLRSA